MVKYPALKVFHKDIPYVTSDWKPSKHLLSIEAEDILDQITVPKTKEQVDVTLRVYCPFNLTASSSKKTAIFGCTEWGIVPFLRMISYYQYKPFERKSVVFLSRLMCLL